MRLPRLTLVFGLIVTACSTTGLEPGPGETATYVLRLVNGEALPYTHTVVPGTTVTVVADTIRLVEGGFTRRIVTRYQDPDVDEIYDDVLEGSIVETSAGLVLELPCNDVIIRSCVGPDTLRFESETSAVIQSALVPPGEKRFERVE